VVLGARATACRAQEAAAPAQLRFHRVRNRAALPCGTDRCAAEVLKGDRSELPIGPERDVFVTVPAAELQRLGERELRSSIERPDPSLRADQG